MGASVLCVNMSLINIILISVIFVLSGCVIILLVFIRNLKVQFRNYTEEIRLSNFPQDVFNVEFGTSSHINDRLNDRLIQLEIINNRVRNNDHKYDFFQTEISKTGSIIRLKGILNQDKVILDKTDIWEMLENDITKCDPEFVKNINNLACGNIRQSELRLAFLIKCRFTPSDTARLLAKSKSTVAYRRTLLLQKLFDKTVRIQDLDKYIQCV